MGNEQPPASGWPTAALGRRTLLGGVAAVATMPFLDACTNNHANDKGRRNPSPAGAQPSNWTPGSVSQRQDIGGAPWGALGYANWTFRDQSLKRVTSKIHVRTPVLPQSKLFLQAYDGDFTTGRGQYHGIQSTGLLTDSGPEVEGMAIFSVFQSADRGLRPLDKGGARTGPGARKNLSPTEDGFLSVRLELGPLKPGIYETELVRREAKGKNDWIDFTVVTPDGERRYVGGILVPIERGVPAVELKSGGGSWLEYFANNNEDTHFAVPPFAADIEVAGNGKYATSVKTAYAPTDKATNKSRAPQCDVSRHEKGVEFDVGESVFQRTPAQTFQLAPELTTSVAPGPTPT